MLKEYDQKTMTRNSNIVVTVQQQCGGQLDKDTDEVIWTLRWLPKKRCNRKRNI